MKSPVSRVGCAGLVAALFFACQGGKDEFLPLDDGTTGDGDAASGGADTTGDGDGDLGGDGGDSGVPYEGGFGRGITGSATEDGFALIDLSIGEDHYLVTTNPWGGAEQTISVGGDKIFTVEEMQAPAGGNSWDVAAFPSVFRGASYGGDRTEDSGMPIRISAIESVRTGMKTNASAITYNGNTTYDVYFTTAEDYNVAGDGPPDVYLMVWFHSNAINPINTEGEGWSCAGQPPTNIEACTGAGSVMIGGKTFHRFVGPNGEATVISYAPEVPFDEWEYDLDDFIEDAVAEGVLTTEMYLQSVQGGFELIEGGAGLTIFDYYVDVNP